MKIRKQIADRIEKLDNKLNPSHVDYVESLSRRQEIYKLLALNLKILEAVVNTPPPEFVRYH